MKKISLLNLQAIVFFLCASALCQNTNNRKEQLRGGLQIERTCYDITRYDLDIKLDIDSRKIIGNNTISFKTTQSTKKIQVDLFENMQIDSIVFNNGKLKYNREFDAVFIDFPKELNANLDYKLFFYYSGNPTIAKNAPWDGGFVYTKDATGKDWVGVACQGKGASLWYPCKDSQSDEPNFGATIKVAVPNGLMNVSNGRFMGSKNLNNGYTRWDWEVKNPINTYDITINVGDYIHFNEKYKDLDLNYYVLRENEAIAKQHFQEVKPMMNCFESKFGAYPFTNDGYKLVETPYLGMEHQSAVAYGNQFKKGYLGDDISRTGVGMLFDFIIIHETAHEWFGNSITSSDIADMWIHEGFTTYAEIVFLECVYGYEKSQIYVNGLKMNVRNDQPIIGTYGINKEGSVDMYPKGALFLNTLRNVLNDDAKWWAILYKFATNFKHKIINNQIVIEFFNKEIGYNLTPIFNQYLNIPTLELKKEKGCIYYRWKTDETDFKMPVEIQYKEIKKRLNATTNWQTFSEKSLDLNEINIATNKFFINTIIND
jgi:aminopeptidase N